jgi:sec-independent protein translocase protein TatA
MPVWAPTCFRRLFAYPLTPSYLWCESEAMINLLGMFGMPGHLELLIIGAIILLLFGHRLPSLMRSLGRGVVEFKKGVSGIDDDLEEAADGSSKDKGKIDE